MVDKDKAMKELNRIGSSKKDLLKFPLSVKKEMGHALFIAQEGSKHKDAKPLKGFGSAKVLEIVIGDGSGTYRTMYTVQYEEVVFVLHAFQKKSKTGIETPRQNMDLVEQRLKKAQEEYRSRFSTQRKKGN